MKNEFDPDEVPTEPNHAPPKSLPIDHAKDIDLGKKRHHEGNVGSVKYGIEILYRRPNKKLTITE